MFSDEIHTYIYMYNFIIYDCGSFLIIRTQESYILVFINQGEIHILQQTELKSPDQGKHPCNPLIPRWRHLSSLLESSLVPILRVPLLPYPHQNYSDFLPSQINLAFSRISNQWNYTVSSLYALTVSFGDYAVLFCILIMCPCLMLRAFYWMNTPQVVYPFSFWRTCALFPIGGVW